ncbi:MAG: helix-turn-helix transcriptional regulator [Bacteroidota bacterium]
MADDFQHIKFHNQQNPRATFDIVPYESIFDRKDLKHSPFQSHLVEFYIILFIEKGKGTHNIDFTDYPCERGTILTVRKDQIHKFSSDRSLGGKILLFTNDFLVSYLEQLEAQKALQLFNELLGIPKIQLTDTEKNEVSEIIGRIKKEYFEINDNYSMGVIRSELHILITKLYRIKSQRKQIISNRKYLNEFIAFQQLVETHVTETTRVIDFARMMTVSTKTLNNISKSIIHKTAKEFIDEVSLKQIKRLLINTELSIKEIAYASGFEETTNFYKYFKRQTNTTPEQFRTHHS